MTAAALVVFVALALWLDRRRETDLADASGSVTTMAFDPIPDSAPSLRFLDVAEESGIRFRHGGSVPRTRVLPEDTGSGLAWADVDRDGDFDLYFASFGDGEGSNRLYRNDGTTFTDITRESGSGDPAGFGMGASFADFDDDGDVDLYVTNRGANRLLRNNGDGTFEDHAGVLGVDDARWSIATAWGDFDRDGRLDLYVTNYVDFDAAGGAAVEVEDQNWQGIPYALNPNAFDPQPNRLYLQEPAGTFVDRAVEAGASDPQGRSMGVAAVDLDSDGWLDLYIANDVSPNALLLSLGAEYGEALFEDASSRTGTADPRGSMGVAVGLLEAPRSPATPLPELFITHWVAQENALYQPVEGARGIEYRDRTRDLRLGEISTDAVGWGTAFVDLDLDGRLDLVVANGSTLENGDQPRALIAQRSLLLWNGGDRLYDLAAVAGEDTGRAYVARGLGGADFDGDGDIDLAISLNRGSPLLLRNDTSTAHRRLGVRLEGRTASLMGARVELVVEGRRQVRWWRGGASFASDHAPELVFGLGASSRTAELTVQWADGARTRVRSARPGSTFIVRRAGEA